MFFNTAGGDAQVLMNKYPSTLLAFLWELYFMGALTYIGNAPNFMVRAIAGRNGIKMPSFFGYIIYSALILLPIFALVTLLFL